MILNSNFDFWGLVLFVLIAIVVIYVLINVSFFLLGLPLWVYVLFVIGVLIFEMKR